ncbi:MAG: two-component regulator propeller domain-containing protein [Acidobacteriota bacterium]|nr:two-component regulator propeller domain-containing protein [Acidobacteriota bacterium]
MTAKLKELPSSSRIRLGTALLLAVIGCPCLLAGMPDIRITQLKGEQGLSENHVFCVLQDQRGFMWFGTRDGLNRYDGYEFKIYRNRPDDPTSLSNNYIYTLFEDEEGIIWVGTRGGLNRFDRKTDTFTTFRHDDTDESSLSHDTIYAFTPGAGPYAGMYWLGTAAGGLNLFDPDTGAFRRFRRDPGDPKGLGNNAVRSLFSAPDGALWVGSEDGLFRMLPREPGVFTKYSRDPNREDSLLNNKIMALHQDDEGRLWIGHNLGLQVSHVTDMQHFKIIENPYEASVGSVMILTEDQEGGLWIGSASQGLYHWDGKTEVVEDWQHHLPKGHPLSKVGVRSFHKDRNGTLWLGTYGHGVFHIVPVPFGHGGDPQDDVAALVKDRNDGIWVGKRGGGLLYQPPNGEPVEFLAEPDSTHGLLESSITSLLEDAEGRIWVGYENRGLAWYDPEANRFINDFGDSPEGRNLQIGWVGSMTYDAEGFIWAGTDSGLKRVNGRNPSEIEVYRPNPADPYSLSDRAVPCIYHSGEADSPLWIGTWNGGLNRMDPDQPGRFISYTRIPGDDTGLSANGILSIYQESEEVLWLATTKGLNRFNPRTGKARAYFIEDGLPSNTTYCVLPDTQGMIWVSTPRGLSRFDPTTEQFRNFTRHDGLVVEDFRENCGFQEKGRLIFGGSGGWVDFNPNQIELDTDPPTLALTLLKLDNKPVFPTPDKAGAPLTRTIEETDSIQLSRSNRGLEIHFAAMHYRAPEKNTFQYKLEGFDPDWNDAAVNDRRATYTNLDSGDYTFYMRAANKDGVRAEPISLKVRVPTPPWLSWWAYTLYVLGFVSLAGGYLGFLHHKLERQKQSLEHMRQVERLKDAFNRELEEKVEKRTRELVGTRKKLTEAARAAGMAEIASDVLHNVGNTLNSVRTSLHLIQERADEKRWLELLDRVIGLLNDHEEALQRGLDEEMQAAGILRTLDLIQRKLNENRMYIAAEGEKIFENVQAIVTSLHQQQERVHTRNLLLEPADLNELLEEALHTVPGVIAGLNVVKQMEDIPLVRLDRLKSLRLLTFLVQNASEAVKEARLKNEGRIAFRTSQNGPKVSLEISDNGVGILPENLSRLFVHGYTTKSGREGFGLHYSANAMKEMGGTIEIYSQGPGCGTTAVLKFPRLQEGAESSEERVAS